MSFNGTQDRLSYPNHFTKAMPFFPEYFFHPVSVVLFLHGGKFLPAKISDDRLSFVVLQLVDVGISSYHPRHLENFFCEVGPVTLAEYALIPAHPNRVSDPELQQGKLSESRTVKGDPHRAL